MKKQNKFISIIWGYSTHMYSFAPEENYHLHVLKVAKGLGFKTYAIVMGSKYNMMNDPNFDKDITVIDYKNPFQFFFQVLKFSFQNSLFYVNSYEWQSFVIPFLARRTIFMAHTQPQRQTKLKQRIQNFVYKLFTAIRLNNEEEKEFLIKQKTPLKKLFVVPLVVSQNVFKIIDNNNERKDLVYFGNITEKKNLPTIIKAFEIVKEKYPDIKLNIIGKMHDRNVEEIIERSKFKKDFVLHGFKIQDSTLAIELNKNLIFINSSFDEGQCVAVYEAALSGCALCLPTIMSFVGVFKDSALFHNVVDYNKLSENIIYYLNHKDMLKENVEKNIQIIKDNYSIKIIEGKLKGLINKV